MPPKSRLEKLFCCIQKFLAEFLIAYTYTAGSCIDHNIELPWNFSNSFSKDLTKKAFDAIPDDCTTDFARYRNT